MRHFLAKLLLGSVIAVPLSITYSFADQEQHSKVVEIHAVTADGIGASLGAITIEETKDGLSFTPHLKGLPPGQHGFHIHENPDCAPKEKDGKPTAALAAGAHYDPDKAAKHDGPAGHGHKGDLPALTVDADGSATKAVIAPRLKFTEVLNRSLMIHAGGDNYSDTPEPLGGGGARMACGVIK